MKKTPGYTWIFAITLSLTAGSAGANPYLPKAGEAPVPAHVGTCAISGGFIHFYSALFNCLSDENGMRVEYVVLRGVIDRLAALAGGEIEVVYCPAAAMSAPVGPGPDAELVRRA